MRTIIETLTREQLAHIIPVIEQGLEFEKATYLATKDPESRRRIADTCYHLSLLYFRQVNINRLGMEVPDDPH